MPKATDHTYLNKINKVFEKHARFRGRIRKGGENREWEFGVVHYAGMVSYDVRGFLVRSRRAEAGRGHSIEGAASLIPCLLGPPAPQEKNKDELGLNLRELLHSSSIPFLPMLFSEEGASAAAASSSAAAAAVAAAAGLDLSHGGPASPATPLASTAQRQLLPSGSQQSIAAAPGGFPAGSGSGGGSRETNNKVSQGAQFRNQVRRLPRMVLAGILPLSRPAPPLARSSTR